MGCLVGLILFMTISSGCMVVAREGERIDAWKGRILHKLHSSRQGDWRGGQASIHVLQIGTKELLIKQYEEKQDYEHEAYIMDHLVDSPYILRPLMLLPEVQSTVFPRARDGDLLGVRPIRDGLSYCDLVEICWQLVKAVAAVHQSGHLHMDIKPENVVREGRRIWLIDYGLASVLGGGRPGVGTPRTMAPECLPLPPPPFPSPFSFLHAPTDHLRSLSFLPPNSQSHQHIVPITEAADWWSVGVTIFYLFATFYELPDDCHFVYFPYQIIHNVEGKPISLQWPPSLPRKFPLTLLSLLYGQYGLFSHDHRRRLFKGKGIDLLLAHPFWQSCPVSSPLISRKGPY